jgi:CheY-like chemotaxis protein
MLSTILGLEVETSCEGEKAIELYQAELAEARDFDCVFVRMHMPRIDGPYVASKIQELRKSKNMRKMVPIIGLSSSLTMQTLKAEQRALFKEVLTLPAQF